MVSNGLFIMSAEPPANPDSDKENEDARQKDVRLAYPVAANLYMQENAATWLRFSIMVTANSILVAGTSVAANPRNGLYVLAPILPMAGLILCFLWWRMTARGFAYHDHWRKCARDIETGLSSGTVRTLQDADKTFRYSRHGPRARKYAESVIGLFVVLYLVALAQVAFSSPWCETALMEGITRTLDVSCLPQLSRPD